MSAARLNSPVLAVRGTLPRSKPDRLDTSISVSFSLAERRGNLHRMRNGMEIASLRSQ
jgi:hypothetical protein